MKKLILSMSGIVMTGMMVTAFASTVPVGNVTIKINDENSPIKYGSYQLCAEDDAQNVLTCGLALSSGSNNNVPIVDTFLNDDGGQGISRIYFYLSPNGPMPNNISCAGYLAINAAGNVVGNDDLDIYGAGTPGTYCQVSAQWNR